MIIKFIVTRDNALQIETFDIDMERNRICKLHTNNKNSYLCNLNEFILKDLSKKRIIPE